MRFERLDDESQLAIIHETILGRVLYSMDLSKDKKKITDLKNALEKVLEKEMKDNLMASKIEKPKHHPRSLISMFDSPKLQHD